MPDICQSHIPSYTILKPAKKLIGERPPGGWHSVSAAAAPFLGFLQTPDERPQDYPYRQGRFINDEWPDSPRLGVQYNICVDEFKGENGATQCAPHSPRHSPPRQSLSCCRADSCPARISLKPRRLPK